jgi:hypothetical protein
MNSCLACGADNVEDVLYCSRCGKRLEPPAPPPEYWRYNTEDLNPPPRPAEPNRPPAYRPPPPYANRPPDAPQQGYEPRSPYGPQQQAYAPRQAYGPQQSPRPYGPPAPYQPPTPATYTPAQTTTTAGTSLPRVAMTAGIVLASVTLLGLIPCLGWLNWFTLIFGKMAIILSIVALVADKDASRKNMAVIGLVLSSSAVVVAILRLIIGGGCL